MLPLGCLPLWGREGVTLISKSCKKNIWLITVKISHRTNLVLTQTQSIPSH